MSIHDDCLLQDAVVYHVLSALMAHPCSCSHMGDQSSRMLQTHQQACSPHCSFCLNLPGLAGNGEQQANGSTAPISAADPASHQETSSDDGEGSERGEHEDSGEDDRGPSRKRARLTPGDLVPDSEQLRLDIGICVKGPEGSETIEVGSCQTQGW